MEKIKDSVEHFLKKAGLREQLNKRFFLDLWDKVVGEHIARYTLPITIKGKKIFVEVTDSVWLYHLTTLKSRIIKDFNYAAGAEIIEDIKFLNADFYSRKRNSEEGMQGFSIENRQTLAHEVTLKPSEEENIAKAAALAPEEFRPLLTRFLKKSCLHQKKALFLKKYKNES